MGLGFGFLIFQHSCFTLEQHYNNITRVTFSYSMILSNISFIPDTLFTITYSKIPLQTLRQDKTRGNQYLLTKQLFSSYILHKIHIYTTLDRHKNPSNNTTL